ncbi:hypothetical protein ACTJJ0_34440 [Chitinophaga sp. 22321]|uniref:Uncharacterized protein n=1 Tax=Chitinophaga hostae TaxID=2831022 RepID=A0ABS5JB10_9BACT|nr:hypothetical protein [Chitinophaga hostae]MBS0032415.1 hypothetical protein [Chitinophaga hostae]
MHNPNIEAKSGDILYGEKNKNIPGVSPHYIIYLFPDTSSPEQFIGAMLTSSSNFSNISLLEEHFEKYDAQGVEWRVYYNASFISSDLYHKKLDWQPFIKVGQLSNGGLHFILNKIGHKKPIYSKLNKY